MFSFNLTELWQQLGKPKHQTGLRELQSEYISPHEVWTKDHQRMGKLGKILEFSSRCCALGHCLIIVILSWIKLVRHKENYCICM